MPKSSKSKRTIQIDKWGTWMNVPNHGCTTEAEMEAYVAAQPGLHRVANDDQEGELSGTKLLTASEILQPAFDRTDDAGKERMKEAVSAVLAALKEPVK